MPAHPLESIRSYLRHLTGAWTAANAPQPSSCELRAEVCSPPSQHRQQYCLHACLMCCVPHSIKHDAPALSLFYPSHLQRYHSLMHSLILYCRSRLAAGPRHFIPGRCACPGGFQPAEPSLGAVLESVAGPGEGGCTPCWCDASPPAQKPATCCLFAISHGLSLRM